MTATVNPVRAALKKFGDEVDKRLKDETAKVPQSVIDYTRAVEKGANDKLRRAARHEQLVRLLEKATNVKASS